MFSYNTNLSKNYSKYSLLLVLIGLFCVSDFVSAQSYLPKGTQAANFLNDFLGRFESGLTNLGIHQHAKNLFWLLASISFFWTFIQLSLKKGDLSDFFTEFVKFCAVTGFFWWILQEAPGMIKDITNGLVFAVLKHYPQAGQNVTYDLSTAGGVIKRGIVQSESIMSTYGVISANKSIFIYGNNILSSFSSIIDFILFILLAFYSLVVYAAIALKMAIIKIGIYFLSYVGVFILGFGGSSFTKEMAINFYKTVIAQGAQLLVLVAIVVAGSNMVKVFLDEGLKIREFSIIQIFLIFVSLYILNRLADEIPQLISNIIASGSLTTGSTVAASAAMTGAAMMGAGSAGKAAMAVGKMDINPVTGARAALNTVAGAIKDKVDGYKKEWGKTKDAASGKGWGKNYDADGKEKPKEQATPLADQHK